MNQPLSTDEAQYEDVNLIIYGSTKERLEMLLLQETEKHTCF